MKLKIRIYTMNNINNIFQVYHKVKKKISSINSKVIDQMQTQKLYYTKYFCPQTLQIVITADFASVKLELNEINKKYDLVNLVTKQGVLTRSNAILKYLTASKPLSGTNIQQKSQLDSWYEYFNIELLPVLNQVFAQVFGQKPANQPKYTYCLAEISKSLKTLDDSLKLKTFFIGHNITIFDITLTCYLENLFKLIVTEGERKKFVNLFRWFNYVRSIPIFNKYLGKLILCGKQSFKIDFNQVEKLKQVEGEVKKQQLKQQKMKQEKVEKKVDNAHTTVPPQKQQVKQNKQPLNNFKFDDFKRQFQNSQNQLQVLQNLLSNFDKENISVWKIHYEKDVVQGKVLFMTENLANGSLQRIENIRKSAFGTWGVYGEEGNYEIRGVMIWQGTDIHPVWREHPSFQFHKFTKLDPQNENDKQLIIDYIMQAKTAEGLTLQSAHRIL